MLASALQDPNAVLTRRGLAAARLPEPRPEATAAVPSVVLTMHIYVGGEDPPAAATEFLENLRALAAHGVASSVAVGTADAPTPPPVTSAVGARPRLVRRPAVDGAGPELELHLASRTVYRDGAVVRLTRREYDLLEFFCQHPRRVFSRGQLLRQVWGYQPVSGERTVDVHVRRIRVKLANPMGEVVTTVRGVGYRLAEGALIHLANND